MRVLCATNNRGVKKIFSTKTETIENVSFFTVLARPIPPASKLKSPCRHSGIAKPMEMPQHTKPRHRLSLFIAIVAIYQCKVLRVGC